MYSEFFLGGREGGREGGRGASELLSSKFQCLTKHMCLFCFGIFVEHKLMCFARFIFRKEIFPIIKTEQEEKRIRKEEKRIELKQAGKDKI